MSGHTPGPWSVSPKIGEWTIKAGRAYIGGLMIGTPECAANARLIAAAPELLEACKKLLYWADTIAPNPDLAQDRKMAIAAIAKAGGGA